MLLALKGNIRERGHSARDAGIAELSVHGCRAESRAFPPAGNQIWVRLPGLENLSGMIVWVEGSFAGISFDLPLHPAVLDQLVAPANDDVATTGHPVVPQDIVPFDPLLSRREQIIMGVVDTERSPLAKRRKPAQSGFGGMISRQVKRRADHRCEPRYLDLLGDCPPAIAVAGELATISDISAGGLRVTADNAKALTIGRFVEVEVEGFDPIDGRIVWADPPEVGIALPPASFDLKYD